MEKYYMEILFNDGHKEEVELVRPPRHILWKHGRTGQAFQSRVEEIANGYKDETAEAQGLILLESMSDDERIKFKAFADDIIRYSTNPQVDPDEVHEISYWQVFARKMYGVSDAPVETKEGVTTVEAVETFPLESALSETGAQVSNVR
jgi:hypothetical protein